MPVLRGLQRAQLWNSSGYVCCSCRHKLLAGRRQLTRSQGHLSPSESGGDDWASNFNDLSVQLIPGKKYSQFGTGRVASGRERGGNGPHDISNVSPEGNSGNRHNKKDALVRWTDIESEQLSQPAEKAQTIARAEAADDSFAGLALPLKERQDLSRSRERRDLRRTKAKMNPEAFKRRKSSQKARRLAISSETRILKEDFANTTSVSPRASSGDREETRDAYVQAQRGNANNVSGNIETSKSRVQFEMALQRISKTMKDMMRDLTSASLARTEQDKSMAVPHPKTEPKTDDSALVLPKKVAIPSFSATSSPNAGYHRRLSSIDADTSTEREDGSIAPLELYSLQQPSFTSIPKSPSSYTPVAPGSRSDKPLSLAQRVDEARNRPKWGGVALDSRQDGASPTFVDARSTPVNLETQGSFPSEYATTPLSGLEHSNINAKRSAKDVDGNTTFLDSLQESPRSLTTAYSPISGRDDSFENLKQRLASSDHRTNFGDEVGSEDGRVTALSHFTELQRLSTQDAPETGQKPVRRVRSSKHDPLEQAAQANTAEKGKSAIERPNRRQLRSVARLRRKSAPGTRARLNSRASTGMSNESLDMLVSLAENATTATELDEELSSAMEDISTAANGQGNDSQRELDATSLNVQSSSTTHSPLFPKFMGSIDGKPSTIDTNEQNFASVRKFGLKDDPNIEALIPQTLKPRVRARRRHNKVRVSPTEDSPIIEVSQSESSSNRFQRTYTRSSQTLPRGEDGSITRHESFSARSGLNTAISSDNTGGDHSTANSGSGGDDNDGDGDGHKPLWEVMSKAKDLAGNNSDVSPPADTADTIEQAEIPERPPLDLSSSETADIHTVKPSNLIIKPLNIPQPSVPGLEYGLDRVLFNPGVYQLQDPLSRVYNFDPYLQKIMPVVEFDFNALKEYKTSSQDTMLSALANEYEKRYIGSTSSMTGMLGHFHYLLSDWRSLNLNMLSRGFTDKLDTFTLINRAPNAIFLRWKNGVYAIDADKQYDSGNVLMLLGKSMEKLLTMPTSEYERYRKSDPRTVSDEERTEPEAFEYTTMGGFLMRSQLDAHDPRLPGTGMFDLKTRAVISVRMDAEDFQPMTGYEIHTLQGRFGSYEREYYDMIRSTMLKYMLQARMGRMDGIFVAYHNVERIFGFQYVPIVEMDRAIHGQVDRCLGDQEFKASLELMNKVFDKATAKFPEQSLRFHFETTNESLGAGNPTTVMWIFAEPVAESEIEDIQSTSKARVAEFEQTMMGIEKSPSLVDAPSESVAANDIDDNKQAFVDPQSSSSLSPGVSSHTVSELITSNSAADSEFINSIAESNSLPRKPLFAASLICKSRINGVSAQRPENLKPTDVWEVEYLLREWDAPDAMWARYEQMKARRKDLMEKYRSEDETADGNENGELTSKQKRERAFIDFLRSMSQNGREFRSKIDRMEAGKEPIVVGQPLRARNEVVEEKVG